MITEIDKPRGIGELLALDTYQGMTDEEIELVISHKMKLEYNRGILDGKSSASTKALERIAANRIEIDKKMREMVESEWEEIRQRRKAL